MWNKLQFSKSNYNHSYLIIGWFLRISNFRTLFKSRKYFDFCFENHDYLLVQAILFNPCIGVRGRFIFSQVYFNVSGYNRLGWNWNTTLRLPIPNGYPLHNPHSQTYSPSHSQGLTQLATDQPWRCLISLI